jgi:hypothetical protein
MDRCYFCKKKIGRIFRIFLCPYRIVCETCLHTRKEKVKELANGH